MNTPAITLKCLTLSFLLQFSSKSQTKLNQHPISKFEESIKFVLNIPNLDQFSLI